MLALEHKDKLDDLNDDSEESIEKVESFRKLLEFVH